MTESTNDCAIEIQIPTMLQRHCKGNDAVKMHASTVAEALANLETMFPGVLKLIVDNAGNVRHFINLYRNDLNVSSDMSVRLASGDQLSIVTAVSGG